MLCPNCGSSVHDGVKFCPECGTKLMDSTIQPVQTESTEAEDIRFSDRSTYNGDEHRPPNPEDEKAGKKLVLSTAQKVVVSIASIAILLAVVLGILLLTGGFEPDNEQTTQPELPTQLITAAEDISLGSGKQTVNGIMDSVKKDGFEAETPAGIIYESMNNLFTDTSAFEFDLDIFCSDDFDGVSGEVVFGKDAKSSLFHLELEDTQPLELLIWDNALYKKSTERNIPSYMRVDFVYDSVFKAWENTYDASGTQSATDVEKCEFTLFSFVYGLFDGVLSTVMKGALGLILPNIAALTESLDDYFYVILDENGSGSGVYGDITKTENGDLSTYTFDFGVSEFTSETTDYLEGTVPEGKEYQSSRALTEISYRAFMLALLNKDGLEYTGIDTPPAVTVTLTVGNSRLRELDVSCRGNHIMKLTLNYEFSLDTNELESFINEFPAASPVTNQQSTPESTD